MAKELRLPRVNTVILSGRLTRDIELRYTQTGTPVAKLPIAFDRNYKDASGEWQSETSFMDVVVWSKRAERCAQYLHKGSAVLIEGFLQARTFVDRENQNRKVVEIVASRVNFLEKEYNNDSSNQNHSSPKSSTKMEATATDDDVPF